MVREGNCIRTLIEQPQQVLRQVFCGSGLAVVHIQTAKHDPFARGAEDGRVQAQGFATVP